MIYINDNEMEKLPLEILDNILKHCETVDIIKFSKTCKTNNIKIKNSIVWKYKAFNEYNIHKISKLFVKNNSYYNIYKYLYNIQCVNCNKRTLCEVFNREKVCISCQKNIYKYHTISRTAALKKYFLKKEHLDTTRCLKKRMSLYGSVKNTVWYLETDVMKLSHNIHSRAGLINLHSQRINKLLNSIMEKNIKFIFLRTYMLDTYNIDIIPYINGINNYSERLYSKYLSFKYLNPSNTLVYQNMLSEIIKRFIEYHYLSLTRYVSVRFLYTSFEETLLADMLSDNSIDVDIPYITEYKEKLRHSYTDLFSRKNEIINYLSDTPGWELEDYIIKDYIYNQSDVSLEDIKRFYIEYIFFKTHAPDTVFYSKFVKKNLIIQLLKRGVSIPFWIIERNS